ncbi:hypothetical protein Tco_1132564 [Tanacetum coccineum]|uniref:Reverse transcriptase domain-containing protein n=1 Tax=Tanacetum coccineum TaxID=301880 RepID=A0ABQ5JF68_9ASTR
MQAARDRQKSYADVRHKPLEFQVEVDELMLKYHLGNGVVRFGKTGKKLNPSPWCPLLPHPPPREEERPLTLVLHYHVLPWYATVRLVPWFLNVLI